MTLLLLLAAPPALLNAPFDADTAAKGRAAWAEATALPADVENSVGMKLVLIPTGRFAMGPNGSTHRVTLTKPFHLGTTEVTLGQYRKWRPKHDETTAEDRPAAMVSWDEARAFCAWLSVQPKEKEAGRVYSLPTEARWEWAARAGTATPTAPRKGDGDLVKDAWFNHTYTPNPKNETAARGRQAMAKLRPNAWGLYDTLGNVWEWCDDRRGDDATGEERQPVMRGGSWRSGGSHCVPWAHDPADPKAKADNVGFRVACTITPKKR